MERPRVRPRFEIETALSVAEVKDRLRAGLRAARSEDGEGIVGMILESSVELVPGPATVHYWSPQLTLELEEAGGKTRLHARFAPHPHVWLSYVAIHAIGALGTIGAAMFGISQYIAGESPWALWALPTAPVLAALVWALAFVGQGLGAEQMYALRSFVDDALDHVRAADADDAREAAAE